VVDCVQLMINVLLRLIKFINHPLNIMKYLKYVNHWNLMSISCQNNTTQKRKPSHLMHQTHACKHTHTCMPIKTPTDEVTHIKGKYKKKSSLNGLDMRAENQQRLQQCCQMAAMAIWHGRML